jgi:hypothetical protein
VSNNQSQGRNAAEGLGTSLMTAAQGEFNAGAKPYTNPLYAGISDTTKSGVNQQVAAANGFAPQLQAAMDTNAAIMNDTGPSLTEQQLMSVAKGEQMGVEAPGYARLREKALDDAMTGVGAAFLTNGRYGSTVMGDAAGGAATDVLAGMDYTNYQNDIARQERALGAIEGTRQQGVSNRASAAAAMPGYAQAMLLPGQVTTAAGQVLDADAQAARLADYDLWTRQNNARTEQIAQFASILNGSQGMPGTEKETPWWQSMLGGATALAGAFL